MLHFFYVVLIVLQLETNYIVPTNYIVLQPKTKYMLSRTKSPYGRVEDQGNNSNFFLDKLSSTLCYSLVRYFAALLS